MMRVVPDSDRRKNAKPRIFVVSPFVDKQHGTERRVAEWISRLADDFDIHIYSQRVDDIDLSKAVWRRIPKLPGPHILNFLWWLVANRAWRSWDRRVRRVQPDLVFSPGINCLDADVISVHVVFAKYLRRLEHELRLSATRFRAWPQVVHRNLYYRLIALLESRIYRKPDTFLFLIAQRTGSELHQHFGRSGPFPVIYLGLDHVIFNVQRRCSLRSAARKDLGYTENRFVLLLIGNDLRNKGLPTILDALAVLPKLAIDVLAVGRENPEAYAATIRSKGLEGRVQFRRGRKDVEFYYAAADAYVGASLEDTFAQPPAEAMACGLPVIVSSTNGACEIINDGVDGLILKDAGDYVSLSHMIQRLCEDKSFRGRIGANAAKTAQEYTWERNARELRVIFEDALNRKARVIATQRSPEKSQCP